MEKENRQVKNSVLVDLFCDDETAEENDIALFNALHEKPLPEGTSIERIRVDNVLYMNFQNDISFGAGGKVLVMGEHQSTVNKNMPLRSLMYIGRAYERIVSVEERYRRSMVKLPKPEFYTFYNGTEKTPAEEIMCLSDAYKVQDGEPMLELKVRVININPAVNHEILEKCPILKEYSLFIDTIRKYQALGQEGAYTLAIRECIKKGILADYLSRKGSEVENMLVAEYDYDMDIAVQREEAFEEGEAATLIRTTINLIKKGWTAEKASELLGEDLAKIQCLYDIVSECTPDNYDEKKIYEELRKRYY